MINPKTTQVAFSTFEEYMIFTLTRILIDEKHLDKYALLSRIHLELLNTGIDDKISKDAVAFSKKIEFFYKDD